ncbi:zf-DHHC-domain-containing protein [Exidia glandulosa HHB12029]|uniref:Palmitoyltransferase n=1 Tax=Exidia glandulosa HHB12029 TaxID=1314781 RepID=A0A165D7R1_EXIGL|nr:zf-DHHC-domain-containing protein [Exidia glandulosa HHB12029]
MPPHHQRDQESSCARVSQTVEARREVRRNRPPPWVVRKLMVGVVLGIVGLSAYVYIGRLVVPALREDEGSAVGRSSAIGLLVGYTIVLAMLLWSYAMIVLVSPGYAIDHVHKTPAPTAPPQPQPWHTDAHATTDSTIAPPPSTLQVHGEPVGANPGKAREILHPELQRQPPAHPVLRTEYRYCYREGIVKPKRTHHCRACGKCVLAYDHHCPWIGQCVGARNARFFFVFTEWGAVYCLYVFLSLLIATIRLNNRGRGGGDIDAFYIAIMALAALFSLFTVGMAATHIRLNMSNLTTLESMNAHQMWEQESAVLANALPWWDARSRREIRKRWDDEWGNPRTEGNIWWLGSASANWHARMGDSVVGWFLPVLGKRSDSHGLDYAVNPRFDEEGRWRRREEWPEHLR